MAFDGIVTHAVTDELKDKLQNGRVMKIYQPTPLELIFQVRAQGKNQQLLISAHPMYSRIHITEEKYQNPKEAPMLCMLLRKHLVGAIIERIEQIETERIVEITFTGKNEIGDVSEKKLVIEIMGKHSNILLIDPNREMILDSVKHLPPSQNSFRTIMPGQAYVYPPSQGKINPLSISGEEFTSKLDWNSGKLDKQIVSMFLGFSPLLAREIVFRAKFAHKETFAHIFETLMEQVKNKEYKPVTLLGTKEDFHVLPITNHQGETAEFSSISEMLDQFFAGKAERDRVKQISGDLTRLLKNEWEKNKRKIEKHYETLKKAEKTQMYQRMGELLTAHLHLVKPGDTRVLVVDYYDPEQKEIEIDLDPNRTPSENAQKYFQTYQKLKKSKTMVEEEIKKARLEMDYLEQILQQIASAKEDDIEEIREELREEGYLKKSHQKTKKKLTKPEPEVYKAADGTTILVGKNNKQNEYLTMKLASRNHIWLHTKDIPGSHVVIQDPSPSEETLYEAAILAAYFSKSKLSSTVPVDYTQIRHVKKPNGAKPGYVIYDNQKTLYVTPEEEVVQKLKG
ncbi:NFACT RNA binding domain-containing protein [Bacillaceae bacterium S4-13-58]